jgi:hypothetical protein
MMNDEHIRSPFKGQIEGPLAGIDSEGYLGYLLVRSPDNQGVERWVEGCKKPGRKVLV